MYNTLADWQNFSLMESRFGKLVKTKRKPCCISKSMGIDFPHPIFMSIFEKNEIFLLHDFPPTPNVFRFKILPRRHEKLEKGVI